MLELAERLLIAAGLAGAALCLATGTTFGAALRRRRGGHRPGGQRDASRCTLARAVVVALQRRQARLVLRNAQA